MIFYSIKEKYIFYHIPAILFSLMPLFLITGPFLPDFSISIIGILFLIYCFKHKNFTFFKKKYFYFYLLFCLYLVLNSIFNNFNIDSFKISIFFFRYGLFIISIAALLTINNDLIKYFFYCIFICFTILILDGFYQYFVGENILGYKSGNKFRVSSFFRDEHILGSYISRLWPIFFGISIFILKEKSKIFYFLITIFILSEVLIFLSGDRSAFFYINLTAIFIILFSKKLAKLRLITLFFSLIMIILISLFNPIAKQRVVDQTLNQMNINSKEKKDKQVYIFTKTHHEIFTSAYKMFLDNKIIGVGVKNFRNFCSEDKYYKNKRSCSNHPHNIYIQILAETGLVGFFFIAVVLFIFCKSIIKHLSLRFKNKIYFSDFEICILSGIAIYLWPFIPTGSIFNNWLNIVMIIQIPFIIWSRNQYHHNKSH